MNCVVEKRRAEEFLNPVQLPFGLSLMPEKKTKVTGERLAIICESNVDNNDKDDEQPEIHVRQFIVPFGPQNTPQRLPIPYGPMPNMNLGPLTHMPMRMMPGQGEQQGPPPQMMQPHPLISRLIVQAQRPEHFQHQPPVPPQVMQAPPVDQPQIRVFQPMNHEEVQPQPQVRIQLHRISIPNPMNAVNDGEEQQENQQPQLQQVPLAVALAKAGITPDDLNNIRKIAEAKFQQQMNRFMEAESENSQSDSSEGSDEPVEIGTQESQVSSNEENNSNILPMGRMGFARSLLKPVNIPIQMMPKEVENTDKSEQN